MPATKQEITPGWLDVLGAAVLLALWAATVVGTALNFDPEAEELRTWQSSMQERIDALTARQRELAKRVEDGPGITELTDEMLTSLAGQGIPEQTEPAAQDPHPELIRIVALECDGSYNGALATATVIFNRLEAGTWGDSIEAVLSAPGQFSTYKSKRTPPITATIIQACQDATNGARSLPPEVQYFCTPGAYKTSAFFQTLEIFDEFAGAVWCRERDS